jgi:GR25 family glycosyltransferase involved in LPS biosynthesis
MPVLSDCFDLVRIVHLPDRVDRYRELQRQLSDLGMALTPGRVEIFVAQRPTEPAGFRSLGSRGCFLSHLQVLRDALARNVESVLVMEDDCEILPRHAQSIVELASTIRERQWGFVYLGHIQPPLAPAVPKLIPFAGPLATTHLYAVHRSALPPLIEYLEACLVRPPGHPVGGPMDVDGAFSMFRLANPHIVTLLANPSQASQRSSRSDITYRSIEKLPGIAQSLLVARRLKQAVRRRNSRS